MSDDEYDEDDEGWIYLPADVRADLQRLLNHHMRRVFDAITNTPESRSDAQPKEK